MREIFGIFGKKKDAGPAQQTQADIEKEQQAAGNQEKPQANLSKAGAEGAKQLETIVKMMGFVPKVSAREDGETLHLEMQGEDMGRLIGKEGATLNALQSIVSSILSKQNEGRVYVKVDANSYRVRREQNLLRMAKDAAQMAVHQQKPVELEPMTAGERRVIHAELQKNKDVHTYSTGERRDRRIIVAPGAAPEEKVAEEKE